MEKIYCTILEDDFNVRFLPLEKRVPVENWECKNLKRAGSETYCEKLGNKKCPLYHLVEGLIKNGSNLKTFSLDSSYNPNIKNE